MKLYFEGVDQKEKWLKYKDDKIGASTVGAVAGLNKYQSPYEVWEVMTGRVEKADLTEVMIYGVYGENLVRQIFQHYHEVEFLRDLSKILVYEHDVYPFLQSTPDDEVFFEGEVMNCEIKTTNAYAHPDEVPDYVLAQCQYQMELSGHKKTLLIWVNVMTRKHGYMIVEYDEDFAKLLVQAAIEFHDLVVSDTPPPPTRLSDYNKLPTTEGEVIADEEIIVAYQELCELNHKEKGIKDKIAYYKLKVAKFLSENTVLSTDGIKLVTYKTQEADRVDTKALKEAGLYEDYSKVTTSRVMRINYKNVDKL